MFEALLPSYFEWWHIPVIFLAGLIGEGYGSVIGGGGIVIQAALVFVGVPVKSAIATSTAGGLGTEAGIISETHKQITDNKKLALMMTVPFTIGGIAGVWLLLNISPNAIRYIMIIAVSLVLAHTYLPTPKAKAKTGPGDHFNNSQNALLFIFMFLSGLYGKIGPGEGTFSKLALMSVLGFSFIKSQGLKAAATVPGRIISLVVTSIAGLLVWPYVITLALSTFIASKYATRIAKRIPDQYLKAVLAVVSVAFVIYLLLT